MYKQILTFVIGLGFSLTSFTQAANYGGGSGTAEDPYQIWDPNQMNTIGLHPEDCVPGKHFKLMADIDLSAYMGTQFNIIGRYYGLNDPRNKGEFWGVFDGNHHIIYNFTWLSDGINYVALFGYTGGEIRNLGMEGVNIQAGSGKYVGGLVGQNHSWGTITNCFSTGRIFGKELLGGLVGLNAGTITDCYSTARIVGTTGVGGLVGEHDSGTISNCYSTGYISGTGPDVGGLVGWSASTITHCYSTSAVLGNGGLVGWSARGIISYCYTVGNTTASSSGSSGGLVGFNDSESTIIECYSTSSISANLYDGGLVGQNNGVITDSYSTGSVSSVGIHGGLVAHNDGTVINCYSTGKVSGTTGGGLVGYQPGGQTAASFWDTQTSGKSTSAGGTPKATAEMKTKSTFTNAGWDFADVWHICEGTNYPKLRWQISKADFACPDGVDMEDLAYYVGWWLMNNCTTANNYCGGADLDFSGIVDFADFSIFAQHWLE
jgi:hypothetical protein